MLVVASLNLLIGRWIDKRGSRGLLIYGSIVQALVWLVRVFARGVGVLFVVDIADRVTDSMIALPMQVSTYQKALEGQSAGRAILFRELAITIGGIFTAGLLVVWVLVGLELRLVFMVAFLASFLPLFIANHHGAKK